MCGISRNHEEQESFGTDIEGFGLTNPFPGDVSVTTESCKEYKWEEERRGEVPLEKESIEQNTCPCRIRYTIEQNQRFLHDPR